MQNQHVRAELQSALAVANPVRMPDPEEIQKLKAEWGREQRALEQEHHQRRAELVGLRGQLHSVQQKLDAEHRGRRLDAAQASLRVSTLERQLDVALRAAANMSADEVVRRNAWLRWSAVCAALTVVCAVIWACAQMLSRVPAVAATAEIPRVGSTTHPDVAAEQRPKPQLAASPQTFSRSLFRLGEALSSLPEDPESVLKAIRAKDRQVCSFQWNKGQPALIYSAGSPGTSISSSLDRCAEAVEKYRSP